MKIKKYPDKPQISLIIAFYKNFDALELIFKSLLKQKFTNFEIIIAEDDTNEKTPIFLDNWKKILPYNIKHVFQEEKIGFRKTIILNKALVISSAEIIVFIDGDVILHKNFLKTHSQTTRKKTLSYGRRVLLSPKITEKLYKTQNLNLLNRFNLIFSKSKKIRYSLFACNLFKMKKIKGILGCNWSVFKDDLIAINGFDTDYQQAGVGEDTDIKWRLLKSGVKMCSVKYSATQFHLFHKKNYSSKELKIGFKILREKQKNNAFVCKNGIKELQ